MSDSKRPSQLTVMLVGCLLCVVSVPLATYALRRNAEYKERYDKIATMTESERKQLLFQYDEFKRLPPERKQHFRNMQAQLEGPHRDLQATLNSYRDFIKTLNPVDRADIESQHSSAQKIAVIERILAQRRESLAQLEEGSAAAERFRSERSGRFFTNDELLAMSDVLEEQLPETTIRTSKIGQYERDDRDVTRAVTRAALVLNATLKLHTNKSAQRGITPFDAETIEALQENLENEHFRERIAHSDDPGEQTRRLILVMYFRCYFAQFAEPPELHELQDLMNAKDQEERNRLIAMRPHELYRELVREYVKTHPTELSRTVAEMKPIIERFPEIHRGGPPPGRPGRERPPDRPGPRGNFNRNRPERGGPRETNPPSEPRD